MTLEQAAQNYRRAVTRETAAVNAVVLAEERKKEAGDAHSRALTELHLATEAVAVALRQLSETVLNEEAIA